MIKNAFHSFEYREETYVANNITFYSGREETRLEPSEPPSIDAESIYLVENNNPREIDYNRADIDELMDALLESFAERVFEVKRQGGRV